MMFVTLSVSRSSERVCLQLCFHLSTLYTAIHIIRIFTLFIAVSVTFIYETEEKRLCTLQ